MDFDASKGMTQSGKGKCISARRLEYICPGDDLEFLAEQAAMKSAFDSRIASKGIVETLRERIVKLEEMERTGAGTPDTCDMLVSLQQMLDELYRLERSHKQLN
jgi:hypothetical protein